MIVSKLRKSIAAQDDTLARKLTVLRRKETLFGAKLTVSDPKVTVSANSTQDPVRCVKFPPPKLSDSAVKPEWV